tara:strand:- start:338 stop:1201 length:864 start_codon:yes stop_codon:yes gene_type:complete
MKRIIPLLILLSLPSLVFSTTIVLKSGKTIEGTVTETTNEYIKVDFSGVSLKYYLDDIKSIDGKSLEPEIDKEILTIGLTDSPESSIIFWKTVISKEPKNIDAHINIASAYVDLFEFDAAIEYFKKVIEIDPKNADSHLNIGLTHISLNQYPKAIPFLEKAIELAPNKQDTAAAHHGLGANQLHLGNPSQAIPHFKKAIELYPNFSSAYANLGVSYAQIEEYEKAVEYLEKTVALDENFADAYHNLGQIYSKLGQRDKAKDAYLKAKYIYQQQGNYTAAQRIDSYLQ